MYGDNPFNIDPDVVKYMSQFSFSESKPMQESLKDLYMVLQMVDMNGKPKTANEIKSSMAQCWSISAR